MNLSVWICLSHLFEMKIFVTGASGFIGKNLIRILQKEGHELTINIRIGSPSPTGEDINAYSLGRGKLEEDIEFFIDESFDGVIHLASLYLANHKSEDVGHLVDSNLKFGTIVLECASKAKVKWFINTGTYWQNYHDAEYSPVNLYAATKQAFEDIARYYIEANYIKFCTIRLFDTYGPGDTRPKIFNLWNKIAESGEVLEMSPGDQLLDISYIDDIIDAYIKLINYLSNQYNSVKNGSVFAVKADKRYSLKELAKVFEEVSGQKLNIKWGGKAYREREVMIPWEGGLSIPGFRPKISLKEGIKLFLSQE